MIEGQGPGKGQVYVRKKGPPDGQGSTRIRWKLMRWEGEWGV